MKVIATGLGGFVNEEKIVAVAGGFKAVPLAVKRAIEYARENGKLIDLTFGRKTRTVIFMANDQIVVTYMSGDTVSKRITEERKESNCCAE